MLLGRTSLELAASPEDVAYWEEASAGGPVPSLHSDSVLAIGAPGRAGDPARTMHAERSIRPLGPGGIGQGPQEPFIRAVRFPQRNRQIAKISCSTALALARCAPADPGFDTGVVFYEWSLP